MNYPISSNNYSHDQQCSDVLDWMRITYPETYCEVRKSFPETLRWSGSWLDTEAMGVDVEYSSWLADTLEETGLVVWDDGEPWAV